MEETVFLNEGGVKVTNARFIVPKQTFAMSAITSIRTSKQKQARSGPMFMIAAGIASLAGIKFFLFFIFIALVLIAAGSIWLHKKRTIFHIVLMTSSGEEKALASQDGKWIKKVIDALNDSIVFRG